MKDLLGSIYVTLFAIDFYGIFLQNYYLSLLNILISVLVGKTLTVLLLNVFENID